MRTIYDEDHEVYNAAPGLRATDLVYAATYSWAHLAANARRRDSDAMRIGRLAHAMIADQESALAMFRSDAPCNPATGKPWGMGTKKMAEWLATLPNGCEYASAREVVEAKELADSVRRHPEAASLLAGASHEVSFYGAIEGVPCKARADLYRQDCWSDIKTTARPATEFPREAVKRGYWLQAAFHCRVIEAATGTRPTEHGWIVVESTRPYGVVVYRASVEQVMSLDPTVTRMVREYAACCRTQQWPGYPQTAIMLDCPAWVVPSADAEEVIW